MPKTLTCYLESEDHQILQSYMLRHNLSQRDVGERALAQFWEGSHAVYVCPQHGILYRAQVSTQVHARLVEEKERSGAQPMDVLYSALRVYIQEAIDMDCVDVLAHPDFVSLYVQGTEFALDRAMSLHRGDMESLHQRIATSDIVYPPDLERMTVVLRTRHIEMLPEDIARRTMMCHQMLGRALSEEDMLGQIPCTCTSVIEMSEEGYTKMKLVAAEKDYASMSSLFEAALQMYVMHHLEDWWRRRDHDVYNPDASARRVSITVSEATHRRVKRLAGRQGQSLRLIYAEALDFFLSRHESSPLLQEQLA